MANKKKCPYEGCERCGGCGVCRDFHGNAYGGCTDDCPYGRWRQVRDWFRRLIGGWN